MKEPEYSNVKHAFAVAVTCAISLTGLTIALAATHQHPYRVFAGAILALVFTFIAYLIKKSA